MIKVTLNDGTIIEVGEGFAYPIGEDGNGDPIVLSAETIESIIMPAGFGVSDAFAPAGENGDAPQPIKVLILEERESKLRIHVPLSIMGAVQLAADLLGVSVEDMIAATKAVEEEPTGPGIALPDEGIVRASPDDLRHLPPPERLG